MPTQRPTFFGNFLAAFRAHSNGTFTAKASGPPSPGSSSPSSGFQTTHVTTTNTQSSHPSTTTSNPRTISTKATAFQQSPPQVTTSPGLEPTTSNTSVPPSSALSKSPNTAAAHYVNMSISPPGATTPLSRGRQRRGSDSSNSSGGFRDILGPEKWYIGGVTASGEEKFYKLGLVTAPGMAGSGKRVRSLDRLSL